MTRPSPLLHFPEPEEVVIRTDYRVGQVTTNALDIAKRHADRVGGEVRMVTVKELSRTVYRAPRKAVVG